MGTPQKHIEEVRRNKYQIGVGTISVSRDLCMAVKYLSTELYSKDVQFLMELIQNAEDNEYEEGVEPSLKFLLTSKDITGTGAPMTLLVFNNEKGFSRQNIDSICSISDSSKTGLRRRGYIGEKGDVELKLFFQQPDEDLFCGFGAGQFIARTKDNFGRRFVTCSRYGSIDRCKYLVWMDAEYGEKAKEVITELLKEKQVLVEKNIELTKSCELRDIENANLSNKLAAAKSLEDNLKMEKDEHIEVVMKKLKAEEHNQMMVLVCFMIICMLINVVMVKLAS